MKLSYKFVICSVDMHGHLGYIKHVETNNREKTMTTNKVNYSIHPRNWFMVDKTMKPGEKSSTSKARAAQNTTAHARHVESHPKDGASRSHLAKRMA